jgi:putative Holliday junction resolvase
MPVTDLFDLPPAGVLLGLDPGTAKIGIASTDAARILASPVGTLKRRGLKATLEELFRVYDSRKAVGLIMGLPLNVDGTSGRRVQSVRTFARSILDYRDVPLAFQDERYSTFTAEDVLNDAPGRRRAPKDLDAAAAAIILRAALDRLGQQP